MGCIQSVNGKTLRRKRSPETHRVHDVQFGTFHGSHEFQEVEDAPVRAGVADEALLTPVEAKYFDIDDESVELSLTPRSDERGSALVSSAIAEMASSQSDGSSEDMERPVSPELALSPNPRSPGSASGSPVKKAECMRDQTTVEFKSASASPVAVAVEAERRMSVKSRLMEVSDLRRTVMAQQLFGVWRASIARDKYENLRANLDGVGKASQVVLDENARLKARLSELEAAITVLNASSSARRTVYTDTDDLDAIETLEVRTSLPASAFVTPTGSSVSYGEFATPFSKPVVPVSIATPPRELRRSWETFLRPSTGKLPFSAAENGKSPLKERQVETAPRIDKDRLKAISADIERLSQSLTVGRKA